MQVFFAEAVAIPRWTSRPHIAFRRALGRRGEHSLTERTRSRRALLPVLLDRLGRPLRRQVWIFPCATKSSPLAQEVPETVQVDSDLLQACGILVKRRVRGPFPLAQLLALRLELLDLTSICSSLGICQASHIHGDDHRVLAAEW
jgi:hypothetical protein